MAAPGFIAWRVRIDAGRPIMVGYTGGENLYSLRGGPMQVQVLTSHDGRRWLPAFGANATVSAGGGSETDFARLPDQSLVAVIRNEAGDDLGIGSKISAVGREMAHVFRRGPGYRARRPTRIYRHLLRLTPRAPEVVLRAAGSPRPRL